MTLRAFVLVVVLLVTACGGSDDSAGASSTAAPSSTAVTTTTAVPASSTTPAPPTTTTTTTTTTTVAVPAVAGEIVPTAVNASLMAYGDFPAEDLPFPDNSVMVYWFASQATERWVAVFKNWDSEASGPQCPGASILQPSGHFAFVSNAPSAPGGCDDPQNRPKLAEPPAGFRQCGPLEYYVTEVPTTEEQGFLYATIERVIDGEFVGSTSQAQISPTPDFVVDADEYTVPADFFATGETKVTC